VHRPDYLSRILDSVDEVGGYDRTPSPTADRVEQTACKRQQTCSFNRLFLCDPVSDSLVQDVYAQDQQISRNVGFDYSSVQQVGKQKGTHARANDSGKNQFKKQGLVNVTKLNMREPGYPGGEYFSGMYACRSQFGSKTEMKQQAGATYSVCHSQCTINNLGHEAGQQKKEKGLIEDEAAGMELPQQLREKVHDHNAFKQ